MFCSRIFNLIAWQVEPEGNPSFVCVNIDFIIGDHYPSKAYVFVIYPTVPCPDHARAYTTSRPKIVVQRLESLPAKAMRRLTEVELSSLQSLLDQEAKKLCEMDGDVCIFELIESHARPFLDKRNHEERSVYVTGMRLLHSLSHPPSH